MPDCVPIFWGLSLIGQKWCTLLFHNLNRTKNKPLKPRFFCRKLVVVAKHEKQFLLLCGENKNTNWAHWCVLANRCFSYKQKESFFLACSLFTVVVEWLLFIFVLVVVCLLLLLLFLLFLLLFLLLFVVVLQPVVIVFVFVQPIVLVFVVAVAHLPLVIFLGRGLFWFCFCCFHSCLASDAPKSHFPCSFRGVFPFSLPKP